jgi:hypothetical protein
MALNRGRIMSRRAYPMSQQQGERLLICRRGAPMEHS